jgi:glycosyltransferase involved in cell wall biosynthesis
MKNIDISIVVPIFNEEENVELLYQSITQVMHDMDRSYEIIFIDDGSKDNTYQIIKKLHDSDPNLKALKLRRNCGQTPAMQAGFDHAKGQVIVSMDGDLQNDPKDIPKFLEKIDEGYDIVCGWRKNRHDEWLRVFLSKIANFLIGKITGVDIHDNGCSLKAYRKEVLKKTRLYSEMHRFIPAMTSLTGATYTEIVVNHQARQFGESKYGFSRIWKVFLDLFTIKMIVGFASRPGLWFGLLSFPFLVLGTLFAFLSICRYVDMSIACSYSIIIPAITLLNFYLFFHLLLFGVLSEIILKTGNFNQKELVASSSIEELL